MGRRRVCKKTALGRKLCCGSLLHTNTEGGTSPRLQAPGMHAKSSVMADGASVHGILQARILKWAAMPSSRGSS